jgi:hypothetical protein
VEFVYVWERKELGTESGEWRVASGELEEKRKALKTEIAEVRGEEFTLR